MTGKIWQSQKLLIPLITVLIVIPLAIISRQINNQGYEVEKVTQPEEVSKVIQSSSVDGGGADLSATVPQILSQVRIEGIGNFEFDPQQISSVRSKVFNQGYFSLFDILVYHYESGQIDLS